MGLEIFNFLWYHGPEKLFFTSKLLIKHRTKQDRIKPQRIGALRVSTGGVIHANNAY